MEEGRRGGGEEGRELPGLMDLSFSVITLRLFAISTAFLAFRRFSTAFSNFSLLNRVCLKILKFLCI